MRPLKHSVLALVVAIIGSSAFAPPTLAAANDPQPNRIRIEYVAPKSPENHEIYQIMKERRALEKMQEIYGAFKLPNELLLRTVECDGVANAWYQSGRVSLCYELLNQIWKLMPKETTAEGITPTDAVAGHFFFVFSHEMGHAMFDMLGVPVFGGSEDAADNFATYIILQFGKDDARRLLAAAAYSYKNYLMNPKVTVPVSAFSDMHSPPPTRFYNMICLAYGADSNLFGDFVTKGYLPEMRAKDCRREYGEVHYAFNTLILPHVDKAIAQKVLHKDWLPEAARPTPR